VDADAKTTYSDTELEAMMADVESELVERKESLRAAPDGKGGPIERIRQAVCAFANDLPGHSRPGVVFVGVRDDGTPSGIDVTDRLLQRLADIKTDGNTLPPPAMSVTKRTLAETTLRWSPCTRRMRRRSARAAGSGSAWVPAGPSPTLRTSGSSTRGDGMVTPPSTRSRCPVRGSPISTCGDSRRSTSPGPLIGDSWRRTTEPPRSDWRRPG